MTSLSEALAPRSDQLNADDLISGPRTLTFTSGRIIKDGRDIKLVLNYQGDNGKPWKPCKTMGRAMVMAWGLTDENFDERIVGKAVRAYRDPEVKFGDQGAVGGIRISHMSHLEKAITVKLTVSQGKKANFVFQPLPGVVEEAQEDVARKWANTFIANMGKIPVADAIDPLIARSQKNLSGLETNRPELHKECLEAIRLKRAVFGIESDDAPLSEDNPHASEGRDQSQMGEQFSGEGEE